MAQEVVVVEDLLMAAAVDIEVAVVEEDVTTEAVHVHQELLNIIHLLAMMLQNLQHQRPQKRNLVCLERRVTSLKK